MKLAVRLPRAAVWLSLFAASAFAQDELPTVNVPNPMGAHTWFIIFAIGAFLLWCISYTIQVQKEALVKKKGREELLHQKEALLDKIADLENRRENGEISDPQHRREMKDLRHSLAKVLEALGHTEARAAKPHSGQRM